MFQFDDFFQAYQYSKIFNLNFNSFHLKNGISYVFHSNYKNMSLFVSQKQVSSFEPFVSNVEKSLIEPVIVEDFFSLSKICEKADYIVCEEKHVPLINVITNSECEMIGFDETHEGRLFGLLNSFKPPYLNNVLKQIELYVPCVAKTFYKNNFPYLFHSNEKNNAFAKELISLLEKNKLIEAFEFVTKEKAPLSFEANNFEKKLHAFKFNSSKILHHSLVPFVKNKKIVHIGQNAPAGVNEIFLYQPKVEKHAPWPVFEEKLVANDDFDEFLINSGNIGALKKKQLNIQKDAVSIYEEVLNYCKNCLANRLNANEILDDLFFSSIEFKKIAKKAKKIIENARECMDFSKNKVDFNKKIENYSIDFAFKKNETTVFIDLFWNLPSLNELYLNKKYLTIFEKMEKLGENFEYYLIDWAKILQLKEPKYLKNKNLKKNYNHLFYWENTC